MNIALWSLQIILAFIFLMAGSMKAFQYDKAKASMAWVCEVPKGFVLFIGMAEVLGAIGLVLPAATGVFPILTPIAGFALALVMVCAAIFHLTRKEYQGIGMNVILMLFSLFVGIGRLLIMPL